MTQTKKPIQPTRLVFDIETDGFVSQLTKIHCISIVDMEGEVRSYADQTGYASIKDGIDVLNKADILIGHNIVRFDVPALQKIYPEFKPKTLSDTLFMSRAAYPNIRTETDINLLLTSPRMRQSHGLQSWGYRLDVPKGDYVKEEIQRICTRDPKVSRKKAYKQVWLSWNKAMHDYCIQDTVTNLRLYLLLCSLDQLNRKVKGRDLRYSNPDKIKQETGWELDLYLAQQDQNPNDPN